MPRSLFDDRAEQVVVGIRVDELLARLRRERHRKDALDRFIAEHGVVFTNRVSGQHGGVRQQLVERHAGLVRNLMRDAIEVEVRSRDARPRTPRSNFERRCRDEDGS